MHKLILPFLFFYPVQFFSQTFRQPLTANYTRLGAYSLNHVDVISSTGNPAALSRLKNAAIAVCAERKYMLSELNNYSVIVGLPTGTGNFGLQADYFGFTGYNETKLELRYGRQLGNKVDVGLIIHYHGIKIAGYGNTSAPGFEVGTLFHLTEKLHAGLKVCNPAGGKFNKNPYEKLSSVYAAGFGFDASVKFFAGFEIEKEENKPVNVNAGFQYKFLPQLWARAGVATTGSAAWFGLGLSLKTFRVDMTIAHQPLLGITPGLLLLFNFKTGQN